MPLPGSLPTVTSLNLHSDWPPECDAKAQRRQKTEDEVDRSGRKTFLSGKSSSNVIIDTTVTTVRVKHPQPRQSALPARFAQLRANRAVLSTRLSGGQNRMQPR
jgi:hypothetical protein